MKKIFNGCLTIIVLFIVLGIVIGACSSDGDKEKTKDETTSESINKSDSTKDEKKEVTAETTKKETKKEKTYKIGDVVKVGKMQYKVKSVSTAKEVGPTYGKSTAGDKYVVIEVTVKNNGDKAVTVDSNFFKLLKGDKTFEADAAASMSANQGEDGNIDNSFFLQKVNPESKISGKVVFDVADSVAKSKDLKLQVQTGAWGTETESIILKK